MSIVPIAGYEFYARLRFGAAPSVHSVQCSMAGFKQTAEIWSRTSCSTGPKATVLVAMGRWLLEREEHRTSCSTGPKATVAA
jgi:hypothetical protein